MAGLGYNNSNSANTPRKTMGIQFVKSSETVGSKQDAPGTNEHDGPHLSQLGKSTNTESKSIPSLMSCQFGPSNKSPIFNKPAPPSYGHAFVKSGESYSSIKPSGGSQGSSSGYRMPGQLNLNKGGTQGGTTFQRVSEAKPVCSTEEYLRAWKQEKDPDIVKLRKLAYEVVSLKSNRPNAKDKLHSAANRVPVRIEFNTQPVFGAKNNNSFLCFVYIEGFSIASGQGPKIKDAKTNAYEAALQKILMPYLRVAPVDPTTKELQVSKEPFTAPPAKPSSFPVKAGFPASAKESPKEVASQHKESNLEAAGLKRRYNEYKPLDEFVIVEPKMAIQDCTSAHTLRRSADFNHMLLEYEYFFKGEAARCVLKIENVVLADVNGVSKAAAKNTASAQALVKLKEFCWIIKTKQAVDSNTKISKDEMLNELNEQSDSIGHDNIGNKLLRKMGWSGGGVGKDQSGIAEPVSLKSVLNREGLGLSATKGVTDEFRRRIKQVIENYAASGNQEDLVFSCDFRLEERQIIHDECRRLNLRSKSKGKGQKRYLCVRRKRSVNQLFDHLMSVGGETARYQLVPPGQDNPVQAVCTTGTNFGSQSQSFDASPKPFFPTTVSNTNSSTSANACMSMNSKEFVPANPNQMGNMATSTVSNAFGNPTSGMPTNSMGQFGTTSHQGGDFPGSNNNNISPGNRQNLRGDYQPQKRFAYDNCSHNGPNSGTNFHPPGSNVSTFNGFNSQSSNGVNSRPNAAMNNAGFSPQVNDFGGGGMLGPAQRNAAPVFRPTGNHFSKGGHHQTSGASNGFQQHNYYGNPNAYGSYRGGRPPFQGHPNGDNMPNLSNRMAFHSNGANGMSMTGDQGMSMACGNGGGMAHSGWNGSGPRGQFNPGRQWGLMDGGQVSNGGYPNQYGQQQGMGLGPLNSFDFNPNMMGGGSHR